MEKQITISIEEYNKLIDMHTKREELPERIEVRKISSKWWRWFKRASCSLLHYNKNADQQKLIKRCINETASTILYNLINGYWRGDLSDYFKDEMIVVRKDSPLVIGKGIEESYISSDIPAILSYIHDATAPYA